MKTFSSVDPDPLFRQKLNAHFNTALENKAEVTNWLLSHTGAPKPLKDFFKKEYSNDHNRVSLCLFSGHIESPPLTLIHTELLGALWIGGHEAEKTGWMHTADFPFRIKHLLKKFVSKFKDELESTWVLMLSHHGSDEDFKEDLLDAAKNIAIGLIPVGSNKQYGHPSDRAVTKLLLRRITPVLVMDNKKDIFILKNYFHLKS